MKTLTPLEAELKFAFETVRAQTKQCNDDSCDGWHCRACGAHSLGWYITSSQSLCDSCAEVHQRVLDSFPSW